LAGETWKVEDQWGSVGLHVEHPLQERRETHLANRSDLSFCFVDPLEKLHSSQMGLLFVFDLERLSVKVVGMSQTEV
jgi:hypothetical protein